MCNLFVPEWRGISLVLFYLNFKHIITVIAKNKSDINFNQNI